VTTFWSQFITDEARPGTTDDVIQEAVPACGNSTGTGCFHGALESSVDKIRKASAWRIAMVAGVVRTPGNIRSVYCHDRVQQRRRRPDVVSISGSGHVTAATAPKREKNIGGRRLAAVVIWRRSDVVQPSEDDEKPEEDKPEVDTTLDSAY